MCCLDVGGAGVMICGGVVVLVVLLVLVNAYLLASSYGLPIKWSKMRRVSCLLSPKLVS